MQITVRQIQINFYFLKQTIKPIDHTKKTVNKIGGNIENETPIYLNKSKIKNIEFLLFYHFLETH